ncbi:hypothetical protein AB0F52_40140 [Amycolatopsis sp. NPDC024027]
MSAHSRLRPAGHGQGGRDEVLERPRRAAQGTLDTVSQVGTAAVA